jgi:hypothetical protein
MKTSELAGPALDWAVAKCEGVGLHNPPWMNGVIFQYSTSWQLAGPIIHREVRTLEGSDDDWFAMSRFGFTSYGSTPLIAAMRCYCCAKLGDEVEVPKGL